MKKTTVGLLALLSLTLVGCGNAEKPSRESSSVKPETSVPEKQDDKVYLSGNLDLGNASQVELTKNGNSYAYQNLSLKRGDSFFLRKGEKKIGFDKLAEKTGFEEGKNGYIDVLNEGIYDISFDGTNLSLTKKGSNYKSVKLVSKSQNNKEFAFTMNDDFTFTLLNIAVAYREVFDIQLDGELLPFDYLDYENVYFGTLKLSQDGTIEAMQKGTFSFALNFALENPLVITSPDLSKPNELPYDNLTYNRLITSFKNQFETNGLEATSTTTLTKGETTTTTTRIETIAANDHYYEEDNGTTVNKFEKILTDSNYYYFTATGDQVKLTNAALIEDPQPAAPIENEETPASTIVDVDRKTKTTADAKKDLLLIPGSVDSVVEKMLNNVLSMSNISSTASSEEKKLFADSFTLTADYDGDYGDGMSITVTAFEKAKSYYSDSACKDELTFKVDSDGHLTSGTYTLTTYGGASKLFKENTYDLMDDIEVVSVETTNFNFTYTDSRVDASSFHLDPSVYVADVSNATILPEYDAKAGSEEIDMSKIVAGLTLATGVNKDDFQIMEYDSNFLTKGYNDGFTTGNKEGDTIIKIGTPYSKDTREVTVHITLKAPSYLSASGDGFSYSGKTYYTGSTYKFKVSADSGADPSITVTSSDETVAKVTQVSDSETAKANGYSSFTVVPLKAGTTKLTIASAVLPSKTTSFDLNVKDPLQFSDIAGSYLADDYRLTLNEDGSGSFSENGKEKTYSFTYTIHEESLSLNASNDLSVFSAELHSREFGGYYISKVQMKDKAGQDVASIGYTSFYLEDPAYNNATYQDESGKATLKFTNFKLSYGGACSFDGTLTDNSGENEHTLVATFKISSSRYNHFSADSQSVDGTSVRAYNPSITWSNTDGTITLKVTGSQAGYFKDKSYTFTQVLK